MLTKSNEHKIPHYYLVFTIVAYLHNVRVVHMMNNNHSPQLERPRTSRLS